jgi:hypothetical protein
MGGVALVTIVGLYVANFIDLAHRFSFLFASQNTEKAFHYNP